MMNENCRGFAADVLYLISLPLAMFFRFFFLRARGLTLSLRRDSLFSGLQRLMHLFFPCAGETPARFCPQGFVCFSPVGPDRRKRTAAVPVFGKEKR